MSHSTKEGPQAKLFVRTNFTSAVEPQGSTASSLKRTSDLRAFSDLKTILTRIDRRGYSAYRDLRGDYDLGGLTLCIDHIQADPFAAPSRIRIRLDGREAAFPSSLLTHGIRRIAMADFLARQVGSTLAEGSFRREPARRRSSSGSGRSLVECSVSNVVND